MLTKREKTQLIRLTVEWLEYLDIYKIEGCTEGDIINGMTTAGDRGFALQEKTADMTRKEWRALVAEVIEAVNAELYGEELEEAQ